jgi:hypothetical protein
MAAHGSSGRGVRLDPELQERVMARSADFDEAFEAAAAQPSPETLEELRHAADELMRAASRVLIEIERFAD